MAAYPQRVTLATVLACMVWGGVAIPECSVDVLGVDEVTLFQTHAFSRSFPFLKGGPSSLWGDRPQGGAMPQGEDKGCAEAGGRGGGGGRSDAGNTSADV